MSAELLAKWPQLAAYRDRPVIVGIRPEDVEEVQPISSLPSKIGGRVEVKELMGRSAHLHLSIDAQTAVTDATLEVQADVEGVDSVDELGDPRGAVKGETDFTAIVEAHSAASEGTRVEIGFDQMKLYFFDPASGAGLRHM